MSHEDHKRMKIFAATGGEHLATARCEHLELPLAAATKDAFPDGELIVKINEDVRGRDCFVVQSTSMPVNDNLVELLIWIDIIIAESGFSWWHAYEAVDLVLRCLSQDTKRQAFLYENFWILEQLTRAVSDYYMRVSVYMDEYSGQAESAPERHLQRRHLLSLRPH